MQYSPLFRRMIVEFRRISYSPEVEPFVDYYTRVAEFREQVIAKPLPENEMEYMQRCIAAHLFRESISKGEPFHASKELLDDCDRLGYAHVEEKHTFHMILANELAAAGKSCQAEDMILAVYQELESLPCPDGAAMRCLEECLQFLDRVGK